MRLRVKIDDELLADAKRLTGIQSTREVIELAMKVYLRSKHDPLGHSPES